MEAVDRAKSALYLWQGRNDADEGALGRRWHQVVRPLSKQTSGMAIVGFACDAGVVRNGGRAGAQHGPAFLRKMLSNLPVRRCQTIADAGDVICEQPEDMESAQEELSDIVEGVLAKGMLPIALGGGHEIAWASFNGLARHLARLGGKLERIGIINLDAHFDLRAGEPNSGTPFRQIGENCRARGWPFLYCCLGVSEFANTHALFRRAAELGVTWRTDEQLQNGIDELGRELVSRIIDQVDHVYLTICLDVLPPWIAPGVSAPSACGVPLTVLESVIDMVVASGKLRLADIAEFNPAMDDDGRTGRVAARLVARIAEAAA